MIKQEKVMVFFDGKCGICMRFKSLIQKLDTNDFIEFSNLWATSDKRFLQTDLVREIHLVTGKGRIYKGYFAVKYIMLRLTVFVPIRFFLRLRIMDRIGVYFYQMISRNRTKYMVCEGCSKG